MSAARPADGANPALKVCSAAWEDHTSAAANDGLEVVVRRVAPAGGGVLVIDLEHTTGLALPPFTPDAHVALRCVPHVVRHYSLRGPVAAPAMYRLGVKIEPESRGGSAWVRNNVAPGARVMISHPRNNFPLVAGRSDYLFVSGGIGITRILPMLEAVRISGQRACLVHLCRSPAELAFENVLRDVASFHDVHLHFDSVAGSFFDVEGELDRLSAQTEVYCCGPTPLMDVVHAHAMRYARVDQYHFEFSTPRRSPIARARHSWSCSRRQGTRSAWVSTNRSCPRFGMRVCCSRANARKASAPPARYAYWPARQIIGTIISAMRSVRTTRSCPGFRARNRRR